MVEGLCFNLAHRIRKAGSRQFNLCHKYSVDTWKALCGIMTGHADKGAYHFNIYESANLCRAVLWECFPCVRTIFVLHLVHYHNNSSPFAMNAFENKLPCLERSRKKILLSDHNCYCFNIHLYIMKSEQKKNPLKELKCLANYLVCFLVEWYFYRKYFNILLNYFLFNKNMSIS